MMTPENDDLVRQLELALELLSAVAAQAYLEQLQQDLRSPPEAP